MFIESMLRYFILDQKLWTDQPTAISVLSHAAVAKNNEIMHVLTPKML